MRNCLSLAALVGIVLVVSLIRAETPADARINEMLEPVRQKYNLPALAAAVVRSRGLAAAGAVGVRKRDTKVAVTVDDQFHLGSDTKAMTATMIAVLVEKGLLHYDDTLGKAFPDLAVSWMPELRDVTLEQLLSHHAGLPPDVKGGWWQFDMKGGRAQRLAALRRTASQKLDSKPGETFAYSNLGYVLAAAMAEKAADASWEDLMARHVLQPLGMKSAGFGPMGTKDKLDEPWPHQENGKPIAPGPFADNPTVMGPAGRIHCSLSDWAKFIADQMRGARGERGFLQPETYRKLHTSPFRDHFYTLGGWTGGEKNDGAGGLFLGHDGSNTMNYATAWVAPRRDLAILVATNQGGDAAKKACHEACDALVERFGAAPPH